MLSVGRLAAERGQDVMYTAASESQPLDALPTSIKWAPHTIFLRIMQAWQRCNMRPYAGSQKGCGRALCSLGERQLGPSRGLAEAIIVFCAQAWKRGSRAPIFVIDSDSPFPLCLTSLLIRMCLLQPSAVLPLFFKFLDVTLFWCLLCATDLFFCL